MKSPNYNARLSVKKHNNNIFYYLVHTHIYIYIYICIDICIDIYI